jgi:dienelactone hydrolase
MPAMLARRSVWFALLLVALLARPTLAAPRGLPDGQKPADARLEPPKDLNGYFPFTPPATASEWEARAAEVRRQVLVSQGIWPMPKRSPPNAVIHGRIDMGDYTVEKAYLESFPGHFVTGSLYRPKLKADKYPVVLCPHGHWPNGRFVDQGEAATRKMITEGAERFEDGGRSPLQSRCMQLARMGCIVFHYDMIGYADSKQISFDVAHRYGKPRPEMEGSTDWGFFSPQAELRCQSIMGLQTYNSVRALDWLLELPEVDATRVGVTGASGGGTQTFLLAAIDPRVTAQFPAVMVSTAMQGGCTCENCSLLRINTGNIELAALFAPKPLGMAAANDWTKEIMTKGLPELQQLYKLLGKPDNVMAKALTHFPHNYNYVSRAAMYSWFNKHLKLGQPEPIVEGPYHRLSADELTVWDSFHPQPPSGDDYERKLSQQWADDSAQQLAALTPKDKSSLEEYRRVVGGGWETLIGRQKLGRAQVEWKNKFKQKHDDWIEFAGTLTYKAKGEQLPASFFHPGERWNKQIVIWIDGSGKDGLYGTDGSPKPELMRLVKAGYTVASIDVFGTGEFLAPGELPGKNRKVKTERQFAGFTYGYNHPLFAQRVHDILTVVGYSRHHEERPTHVHLVGVNGAGAWASAAAVVAGLDVDRVAVDTQGFRFAGLTAFDDAEFVPGALKYGDVPGLLSLAVPHELLIFGENGKVPEPVLAAYQAEKQVETVQSKPNDNRDATIVEWLMR